MRHPKARHGLIWYQDLKTSLALTIFISRGNYYEGKVGLDPRLWIMSLHCLCHKGLTAMLLRDTSIV